MPSRSQCVILAALAGASALLAAEARAQVGEPIRWEPYHLEVGDTRVDTVELGRLTVPEVRGQEGGAGTVELAFVRLRARTASPGAPIIYLDGGPGGSGVGVAEIPAYHRLFDSLRDVADVILLSQRGTGLSRPRLLCPLVEPLPDDLLTTRARMIEAFTPSAAACAETWRGRGVRLGGYTTVESADDLEALRRALGEERISLLGFSYGTHLALAAVRRHPASIERAVLVGTEGPDHTLKLPSSAERQLRHLSALAAADPNGAAATPDLYAAIDSLLTRLDAEPVSLPIGAGETARTIRLGGDGMRYLLQRDMGDTNDHPIWPAATRLALDGDYRLIAALAARRMREMGGIPLMGLLMDCASGASDARMARIRAEAATTLQGAMPNQWFPEICALFPEAKLGADYRTPFTSDVPTLFLSGTLDANTPPWQAHEVAWGWPHAEHVLVANAGHESILPEPAAQRIIVDYLAGRSVDTRYVALPSLRFVPVDRARAMAAGAR